MVIMMASIAYSPSLESMCMGEIAPVWVPAVATLLARIFSKIFPGQESSDIGLILARLDKSERSGLGIGMQMACFLSGGKTRVGAMRRN